MTSMSEQPRKHLHVVIRPPVRCDGRQSAGLLDTQARNAQLKSAFEYAAQQAPMVWTVLIPTPVAFREKAIKSISSGQAGTSSGLRTGSQLSDLVASMIPRGSAGKHPGRHAGVLS